MKRGFMFIIFCSALLIGCDETTSETMALLDDEILEVNIAKYTDTEQFTDDYLYTFTDKQSIQIFKKAITTAKKLADDYDWKITDPDYNVYIKYEDDLPTHAIYFWLGDQNKKSMFMFIVQNDSEEADLFLSTPEATNELRQLLQVDD